ncbi:MAG TPA: HDIG domain-containing protein [Nitrospirota bacterium]|nr:HDIG domain-containing protein [Nitrospirota bacterium]
MREEQVLVNAGCSPDIVAHCIAVSQTALSIATRVTIAVDRELVRQGGLFHDIGRSRTHGIGHAIAGVEIGNHLGFSSQLINIIERHIGAGITAPEAERLGLPKKDYLPLTPEEKIVSYADNLISGVRELPFYEALERFKKILGPDHEGVELFVKQHREIRSWLR